MKSLAVAAGLVIAFSVSPSFAGGGGRDARGTGYGTTYGQGYKDPNQTSFSQSQEQASQTKRKVRKQVQ